MPPKRSGRSCSMTNRIAELISYPVGEAPSSATVLTEPPNDGELLDAYFSAVITAATRGSTAGVNIDVHLPETAKMPGGQGGHGRGGSGSGFVFTPDGF